MKRNPFTPVQNLALLDLRLAWPRRKIVLIGASALACQIEMTFSESGHVMNLTGFDLALTHNIPMPLNQDISLAVAAVPVVIVLKMAAWLDRPSERDRDLQDIAHVLNEYLVPDDARRWQDAIIDTGLPHDDQSAFALGQDIGAIVADVHRRMIDRFMGRMADDASVPHAQFARCFGAIDPSATLVACLRAFRRGLGGQ